MQAIDLLTVSYCLYPNRNTNTKCQSKWAEGHNIGLRKIQKVCRNKMTQPTSQKNFHTHHI